MIEYIKGNLLQSDAEALVNTVNTQGVMGKGIALQFKERFPLNFKLYADACKKGEIITGQMFVVKEASLNGEKYIVNFPTKTEWFRKSQYSYIENGLKDLVRIINEYDIKSIAIPPLGCGNGGLRWDKVKPMIENYLGKLSAKVVVFEPNEAIKEILKKEGANKDIHLTPARVMLLYALALYERRGEMASVFAANKLAYFLQESGEPLKLKFIPYTYGPYAQAVDKVLYALNGKYITGLEQMDAKAFEPLEIKYENFGEVETFVKNKLTQVQRDRLASVFQLIEGFESTLSLEVLSSIHFLRTKNKNLTRDELLAQIQSWSDRKKSLIKEEYIDIALKHLDNFTGRMSLA